MTTESGQQRWTLVLASLGAFMAALDTLVVSTALPVFRTDLGASLQDLEWTVNSYDLAFACLVVTGAALGDRYGRRRMYAVGVGIFTLASVAAALAPDPGTLIAARTLQGAGAAVVLPLSLTLISTAFPPERRGAVIGLWGGITGGAVAAGPLVGGAVTSGLAWQWIFWLNVPIGLALIPLSPSRLRESHGPRPELDVVGLCLAGAGLLGLTWGAVRAPEAGWGSGEVVGTMAAGAALVVAFLRWERRARHPMLPLAYFRRRGFAAGISVSFFLYAALFGALFMITQLLQTGLGYSPLEAGLRILPWTGMPALVAPLAGVLADRHGNRAVLVTGLLLKGAGLGWLSVVAEVGVDYRTLVAPFVLAGIGISLCFPTVASAVMSAVPPAEAGVASGASTTLRQIGGVVGVAVLAAVFAAHGGYGSSADFVAGFTPALRVAAGLALAGTVAAALLPGRTRAATPEPEPVPVPGP